MKTKLSYTVRNTRAPGETDDSIIPVIVERLNPVELETVVENCIDRGLIAGLKPTAAHGIAEGVAAQIAREFTLGRGVQFGRCFYGRPYLSGTVDANGRLTFANGINVRLYKGDDFRLRLDDFSFTFDGAGDAVKIGGVYGDTADAGGNTYGQLVEGAPVKLNGRNLYAVGDTDKVRFAEVGGTAEVEVSDFSTQGADLLSFAWPTGLVAGKSYRVTVERTDVNGVTRTSASKTVSVKASATPPEPPTPIAESEDGTVKVFTLSDGGQSETFTAGHDWEMTGEGLFPEADPDRRWKTTDFTLRTGDDEFGVDYIASDDGRSLTVQAGDGGLEPGTYADAVLDIGLQAGDGASAEYETLHIPITFVISG